MMKCLHCGNKLKPQSKFCDNCGAPVVEQPEPVVQQPQQNINTVQQKKNGLKTWHIVLIVVGGIFALLGLFFCFIMWIAFSFGNVESTSKNIRTEVTQTIDYSLDDETQFRDLFLKYDKEWTKTEEVDNLSLDINDPFIQINLSAFDYDPEIISPEDLIDTYSELDEEDTLIDSKSFKVFTDHYEPAYTIRYTTTGIDNVPDSSYREYIAFSYNNCIYTLSIYGDTEYMDSSHQIITDVFDSVTFSEIEITTGASTTEKPTVKPTVKATEKPTVKATEKATRKNNEQSSKSNTSSKTNNNNYSQSSKTNSNKSYPSYQSILDDYSSKLKDKTPDLIDEYNNESAGHLSDLNFLAELVNKKVQKLAKISNEGVQKMAETMYGTSDSYSNYEDWSMKLYDVYQAESQKIYEVYTNSYLY